MEYAFPLGTVLGAGEVIVLSETNSAAFQAYYGVPVFGTYTGKLDNDGEELLLMRPGDLEELTGEVPYIVVERVDFNDAFTIKTLSRRRGFTRA